MKELSVIDSKEKKVEYIELIYDLIFVYIIGRNNSLLHHVPNGFVEPGMFGAYVLCTLAVIQIWNFTIYYINAKRKCAITFRFYLTMAAIGTVFAGLMLCFRNRMYVNIALTVIFVFGVFSALRMMHRKSVGTEISDEA